MASEDTQRALLDAAQQLVGADGLQLQALLDDERVPTGDVLAAFCEALAAAAWAAAGPTTKPDRGSH